MRKIIYTALMGEYDHLKEPLIITPGWKYICYTNRKDLKSNVWEFVHMQFQSVKQVRDVKIRIPFEYDISIWVDASIEIQCNLDNFIRDHHKGYFTLMQHPHRNCVYMEAEACIKRRKDNSQIITDQIQHYRRKGYPSNNGMVATGLLIRTNCIQVREFCERWYGEVNRFSRRDQLSFNFVLSEYKIKYNLIPFSILENEFYLYLHNNNKDL